MYLTISPHCPFAYPFLAESRFSVQRNPRGVIGLHLEVELINAVISGPIFYSL
mgnify:CR=1 FL=1|jgi:hypothetical protein